MQKLLVIHRLSFILCNHFIFSNQNKKLPESNNYNHGICVEGTTHKIYNNYFNNRISSITAAKQSKISNFAYILGVSAAFCTSFYSFRLLFLVFCNSCNAPKRLIEGIHEGSIILLFPLFVLALGSISLGFLSKDLMIGLGTPVFYNSIYTPEIDLILIDSEFLPSLVKNIPLILTIAGFISSFLFINCYVTSKVFSFNIKLTFRSMFIFLSKK